jgi:hypothetical protein
LEVVMRFAGNFHPEWGYLAPAPNVMRTARIVVVATAIGATAGAAVVLSLAERSAPGPLADAGKTLVVVHSLVQPAEAAAPATAPVAAATPAPVIAPVAATAPAAPAAPAAPSAPAKVQASVQPSVPANPPAAPQASARPVTASAQSITLPPAPSDSRAVSTSAAPASVAALSESPPVTEAPPPPATDNVAVSPAAWAPQKSAIAKPPAASQPLQRGPQPAVAAAPRKKPADQRGLGPILRRLFSANYSR